MEFSQASQCSLFTLLIIWGFIILFFVIFVPLVTTQINYFSTIDSEKIVQIVAGPINKVENLFRAFNKDITNEINIQDYMRKKVSEVLSINMIQNFIGSLIGILGNVLVGIFSITFITFFFPERSAVVFRININVGT